MIRRCTCCAKAITAAEWDGLLLLGILADDLVRLELRNCECGTTLSVPLPQSGTVRPAPKTGPA